MLKNAKHEAFARNIVAGKSATRAYLDAGYGGTPEAAAVSANRLLPKVADRIAELRAEIAAKLDKATIRELNSRVRAYQDRWERMQRIIDERAADLDHLKAPGGGTGLLVRTFKTVGSGERSVVVEEFAVDAALLREMRELELQAAKELGQFEEKHHVSGSLIERLEAGRKRIRGGSES